jgi:hypothetical protein
MWYSWGCAARHARMRLAQRTLDEWRELVGLRTLFLQKVRGECMGHAVHEASIAWGCPLHGACIACGRCSMGAVAWSAIAQGSRSSDLSEERQPPQRLHWMDPCSCLGQPPITVWPAVSTAVSDAPLPQQGRAHWAAGFACGVVRHCLPFVWICCAAGAAAAAPQRRADRRGFPAAYVGAERAPSWRAVARFPLAPVRWRCAWRHLAAAVPPPDHAGEHAHIYTPLSLQ